jgi:hypothetical protein
VQVPGLCDQLGEALGGGRRPCLGPERGDQLVALDRLDREQLHPRALLRAELTEPQLPAVGEAHQQASGAIASRRPLIEEPEPPSGHKVDQQREPSELDHRHLARSPYAAHPGSGQRGEGRLVRLHRHDARGECRLHLGALQRAA